VRLTRSASPSVNINPSPRVTLPDFPSLAPMWETTRVLSPAFRRFAAAAPGRTSRLDALLHGIASAIDVPANLTKHRVAMEFDRNEGLASDWQRVGGDLVVAVEGEAAHQDTERT
jgi:hypothetical protein